SRFRIPRANWVAHGGEIDPTPGRLGRKKIYVFNAPPRLDAPFCAQTSPGTSEKPNGIDIIISK
ncbi:MAG: hypothetical protein JXA11_07630, partial [Phycisphaerae bacterium]|nr:hypothetical protein [Phycisphaerae bacterium]